MTNPNQLPTSEEAQKLIANLQKHAEEYYKTPNGRIFQQHLTLFETWIKARMLKA